MRSLILWAAAAALLGLMLGFAWGGPASAAPVAAVDFDTLELGATIVGPVGPEVETTFVSGGGDGLADFSSSVSCPSGFGECAPTTPGALFTYVHRVIPGIDLPNDPPFPAPGTVLPFDDVSLFRLDFSAAGFTGLAGYSFSEAESALEPGSSIAIELEDDGSLSWTLSAGAGWDSAEPLTFFWTTTQGPSGPGGLYALQNAEASGTANGPLPIPLPAPIPEPNAALLFCLGLGALLTTRPRS